MCFHSKQSKKAQQIENRFKATFKELNLFNPTEQYNGFEFPKTPIITNQDNTKIEMYYWGLVPDWANKDWDKTYTLNARIETLNEKPAFKNYLNNRCIILVDGFYEWKQQGKQKIKYEIGFNNELFAFAGLFINNTYTIITAEAKGVMREIHNTKLRMPVALLDDTEINQWLNENKLNQRFDFSTKALDNFQGSLF